VIADIWRRQMHVVKVGVNYRFGAPAIVTGRY
jgi:hypothetical protein